jgi:type I restriction-modification system DNA methylase subunit
LDLGASTPAGAKRSSLIKVGSSLPIHFTEADFAFVLHALSYLSNKGRAAIVCFPGIFYRGGAEKKIRKYLIDNDYRFPCYRIVP